MSADIGRTGGNLVDASKMLDKIGRNLSQCGRARANSHVGEICRTLLQVGQFGQNWRVWSVNAGVDQIWPEFGTSSANFGPGSTKVSASSARCCLFGGGKTGRQTDQRHDTLLEADAPCCGAILAQNLTPFGEAAERRCRTRVRLSVKEAKVPRFGEIPTPRPGAPRRTCPTCTMGSRRAGPYLRRHIDMNTWGPSETS